MLGFSRKLPISEDDRRWVDQGFVRLENLLEKSRLLETKVILPNDEYFPDRYDASPEAAEKLFRRICGHMAVSPSRIQLRFFIDAIDELREAVPFWSGNSGGCAGLFRASTSNEGGIVIELRESLLREPSKLIATIAHELGHVILLGGGLMTADTADHEPMTDLLTVFLGLGIFTANAAFHFQQYQGAGRHGWSMDRLGYLRQEVYGYALARFAHTRGEYKPAWSQHLSTNVRSYFRSSAKWLAKNFDRKGA